MQVTHSSLETHNDGEKKLYFLSAVSTTHDEWTVHQILVHLGLFSGTRQRNEETAKFHARQNVSFSAAKTSTFQGRRPDGVAFDAKGKQCIFLEFTCPMDSVLSSDEGDWAEGKEVEKSERYGLHRYCINNLSALSGRPWNCSLINFVFFERTDIFILPRGFIVHPVYIYFPGAAGGKTVRQHE